MDNAFAVPKPCAGATHERVRAFGALRAAHLRWRRLGTAATSLAVADSGRSDGIQTPVVREASPAVKQTLGDPLWK